MIRDNLQKVLESIQNIKTKYKQEDEITLVAVSKYSSQDSILQAYEAGQCIFGENKVQDLSQKATNLAQYPIEWHFIGTLQENKINALLAVKPALIHSLHSHKLAIALQKRLKRENLQCKALLQLNIADEETKHGFLESVAYDSYLEILESCPNILLSGLMCMAAHTDETKIIEKNFMATRKIFERVQKHGAKTLSMGMSSDYEIAIACGSNCVRIGSAIFKK